MRIGINPVPHLTRLSQLTQKTNQFNLTIRRYSEHQMQEFMAEDKWLVADILLADVFGDSGIVGLAIFRFASRQQVELDTFLMSCRVIGREAEAAFLHAILRSLPEQGVTEVLADFIPTSKNELVQNFLPEQGFEKSEDGRYRRDLIKDPPHVESAFPISIEITAT